jgi:predicted nuclease with TOPRIM domain
MIDRLKQRLGELQEEFSKGHKKLGDLDAEATALRQTLLRISGAIQVLEEEIQRGDGAPE